MTVLGGRVAEEEEVMASAMLMTANFFQMVAPPGPPQISKPDTLGPVFQEISTPACCS